MISEERLREAAQRAGKALADSLPEPEDCHHEFSPELERKMQRLIRKHRRLGFYRGLKRVACVLLLFLLCGGTFLTVNAEAREIVFGWVSESVENTRHYFFREENTGEANWEPPSKIYYELPKVPEEYWLDHTSDEETYHNKVYVNEKGQYLTFGYNTKETPTSNSDVVFGVDGLEKTTVLVHGLPADYYFDDTGEESNLIVWRDEENEVLLYVIAYLDKDEMIALAESVIREEK